jgi:glucose-6-phosphate dehydrogenase-like protein OpcA
MSDPSPTPEPVHPSFERFACGDPIPVEIGEIERELSSLWQQASSAHDAPGGRAGAAVSRAALWNVIIPARGGRALAKAKAMVDALAPALPVRAMTLCLDDSGATRELTATIESNVVSQPGGARVVYSEEITLVGPTGAEAHFGAMVRALQIPGVPTATLWLDASMPAELLTRELLPLTDRLVVDTASCAGPTHLRDIDRLAAKSAGRPVMDLGWLRLGSFRQLFAGLFDPPVGGAPLGRANKLIVRHRAGFDASALLLVAWLGERLGWRPERTAELPEGGLRVDFDGQGRPIAAHLVPVEGACDASGVLSLQLVADGDEYRVNRTATDEATVHLPIAPSRTVKLDFVSDAELCAAALGPLGRDPLCVRCLRYAGRLWSMPAPVGPMAVPITDR